MGLFDFFKEKKPGTAAERPRGGNKDVVRFAEALHKRAQNYDRQEALDGLAKIGTGEAAAALLKRFFFTIEPSITDQDEKEQAYRALVGIGEAALPAVRDACAKAESLTWPLRIMRELLDEQAYVGEVLGLLEKWDTEYDRNPDPKNQLLATLETVKDERIRGAVERFLGDFHEPTRFQAATALLGQDDAAAAGPLARALIREEAVRTQNRIAEGLVARGWPIPESERASVAPKLPRSFALDADGVLRRR